MAARNLDLAGLKLTKAQLDELVEALDSHVYWQLSDERYRDNGFVDEPGSDDAEMAKRIRVANKLHDLFERLSAGMR